MSSKLEDVFSIKESKRPELYSMIWVLSGMIDLSIDGVLAPINENQMMFITPSNYIQIVEVNGKVQILQFNREFYCIRDNDHEVSCNGILYFGSRGVQTISLKSNEVESFGRLVAMLHEEFEIKDTIQEEMLRVVLKRWLIKSTRILRMQSNFSKKKEAGKRITKAVQYSC